MKSFFIFLITVSFLVAQNDSLKLTNTLYQKNDTLVDFNKINRGIIQFQLDTLSKNTLSKNGLSITNTGAVIVSNPSMLSNSFTFDIKTHASDEEWYINTVVYKYTDVVMLHITSDKIEMANGWRKDGKIYVVIAVALVLFFVIIFYLIVLERKTAALSKKVNL